MKYFNNKIGKKLCIVSLAALLTIGGSLTNLRNIKAAEDVKQVETMSDEEASAFLRQYLEDNKDRLKGSEEAGGIEQVIIEVLLRISQAVLVRVLDEGSESVMECFFGEDTQKQTLKMLKEIDGKLDNITKLLQNILEKVAADDVKKSIQDKQKDIRSISNMLSMTNDLFENAANKGRSPEKIKELRWQALQEWYKYSLNGSGNSITSFQYLCDRLVNKGSNFSFKGNYSEHYEIYTHLVYHWDTQMVAFADAQKTRDLYYVAEMAAMNLLYIQYAEDNKVSMDYDTNRKIIAEGIKQVVDSFQATKVEQLEKTNDIKYIKNGVTLIISENEGLIDNDVKDKHIKKDIHKNCKIWDVEQLFKNDIADRVGYHMMTNQERDALVNTTDQYSLTLNDDMAINAGFKNSIFKDAYLTSACEGYKRYYHYGDQKYYRRALYFEQFNPNEVGKKGYMATQINKIVVKGQDNDRFDTYNSWNQSQYNECLTKNDGFEKELGDMLGRTYKYFYVRNDSKGVATVGYEKEEDGKTEFSTPELPEFVAE